MLNVTGHQGNANQNHNKIITAHLSERLLSKRQQVTSVGKDVEKRESSHIAGGEVRW